MGKINLNPLLNKRAGFVQERQALLDKAIAAGGLTPEGRKEQERLAGEIRKMDDLIKLAQEPMDGPTPYLGAPIDDWPGTVERGQRGDFASRGYATEHRDLADFIRDVRFPTERRVMSMNVGATGGFMIPDQLLQSVLQVTPEAAVITAKATTIQPFGPAPDAATTIPTLDQSGARGILGGVVMQWLAEGGPKPETEPALKEVKLEPHEIAGYTIVTDKLIRNGGAEFDSFLRRTLGAALNAAQEQAFINGTGGAMPQGILNAPCRIEVPRAGAGAIAYADLVAMISVFGPDAWNGGFWLASQTALPQLLGMVDPGAAGTLLIRPSELRQGQPPSLLGLPLYVSTRTPALGATGDVMLINASYYLRKLGSGPFITASDGPLFRSNQTIIKIFANVDGAPWLSTPVLMEDGVTQLSPFIILGA